MESGRPEKKLRVEAATDEEEEISRLKERVKELESLLEEGKKEMKEAKNKVPKLQNNSTQIHEINLFRLRKKRGC